MLLWIATALGADLLVGPAQAYTTIEDAVNAAASGDVVIVDPGTYDTPTIQVNLKVLTIQSAGGPGTVQINTTSGTEWIRLTGNGGITLEGLDIDGGSARRILDVGQSTVTVRDCAITNTASTGNGGAINSGNGDVVIERTTFTTSSAGGDGGFLRVGGTLSLTEVEFDGGTATGNGGAVATAAGVPLTWTDGLAQNNAGVDGSVVYVAGGALDIDGVAFLNNVATGAGTVWCDDDTGCELVRTVFEGNTAAGEALMFATGTGVHAMRRTLACGNTGSSLFTSTDGALRVRGTILFDNSVEDGGIVIGANASGVVRNSHLVAQTATTAAPAILADGELDLNHTLVSHNDGPAAAVVVNGTYTGAYNVYWDNLASDTTATLGATEQVADPMLIGTTTGSCDYTQLHPVYSSPLVDGGDPNQIDLDGTRSDIGAFSGLVPNTFVPEPDADDDGTGISQDCDDSDPDRNTATDEIPCNGVDEDCLASTPDNGDQDEDGVGLCEDDCDDTNPGIYPGAPEKPYDGIDQDCDGEDLVDVDGDGVEPPWDCDDEDASIYPGAEDIPGDNVDQDCTGADASADLTGQYGFQCSCRTGEGSAIGLLLLVPLLIRRRR